MFYVSAPPLDFDWLGLFKVLTRVPLTVHSDRTIGPLSKSRLTHSCAKSIKCSGFLGVRSHAAKCSQSNALQGAGCGFCHSAHLQKPASFDKTQRKIVKSWSAVKLLEAPSKLFLCMFFVVCHERTHIVCITTFIISQDEGLAKA